MIIGIRFAHMRSSAAHDKRLKADSRPLTQGAWIEIAVNVKPSVMKSLPPNAGAWIDSPMHLLHIEWQQGLFFALDVI